MAHLMESAEAAATELVRFALFDRKLAKEAFAFIEDFEWPAIGWQYQAVRERATTGRLYSANLKDHPVIRDLQTAPAPAGDDLITQTRLLAHQVIAAKTMMRLGLLRSRGARSRWLRDRDRSARGLHARRADRRGHDISGHAGRLEADRLDLLATTRENPRGSPS